MDNNRRRYLDEANTQVKNFMTNNKTLVYYPKDNKRNKLGVIIAYTFGDTLYMGWSKVNRKGDKFNKAVGLVKAIDRSQPVNPKNFRYVDDLPWSFEYDYVEMFDRAVRYFKQLA